MHYWRLKKHGDPAHKIIHVKTQCEVADCNKFSRKRKLCQTHYERLMKWGDVMSDVPILQKHGLVKSSEYNSWRGMKNRCLNKNHEYYKKGITICDRWIDSFTNFLEDMGQKPDGYSLDRIDPLGNYEPSNCRWANQSTQSINKIIKRSNTGMRGIHKNLNGKYYVYINKNKTRYHVGNFDTLKSAVEAYNKAAIKYHGSDARLNRL